MGDASKSAFDERQAAQRSAMLRSPTVALTSHGELEPPSQDAVLVTSSVTAHDEVVALWAPPDDRDSLSSSTSQPGWATFPDSRASRPVAAVVTVHSPAPRAMYRIEELQVAHPMLELLPNGNVLFVGARAYWRPEGAEENAIIYDADGQRVRAGTLGDGVEHVQVTRSGDIWVGYFDEGVYGNYGWGRPGGPTPLGASGLVRFTPQLEIAWQFPSHINQPWGGISDCYALNADDGAVWTCYYTDFPIVRLRDDQLTHWQNDAHGAQAVVADGSKFALVGGHRPQRDRLITGRLEGDHAIADTEVRLVLPDGGELPERTKIIGRGTHVHVLNGTSWYRIDPIG